MSKYMGEGSVEWVGGGMVRIETRLYCGGVSMNDWGTT